MSKKEHHNAERRLNYAPLEIKEQAAKVRKIWKANRAFRMSDAAFEDFEKVYEQFDRLAKQIEEMDRERHELIQNRNKVGIALSELTVRARSGMRGYFGPQSAQYRQVKLILPRNKNRPAKPAEGNSH